MLKSTLVTTVLGGSLVLAGCTATSSTSSAPSAPATTPPTQMGTSKQAPTTGNNALSVSNQKNGKSITIASATLEKQGFVMLLKTDTDGNPTDMVGVSESFTGTKSNVSIELMESFKPGDKLFAMLHTDANTNGKFEWPGPDEPINDAEGLAIMQEFTLE